LIYTLSVFYLYILFTIKFDIKVGCMVDFTFLYGARHQTSALDIMRQAL
jgi:hypothetical protein